MLFSSTVFLFVFLPAVLLGNYLLPLSQRGKNLLLLLASLLFYAWGEPIYVFLMLFSIAANYGLGLLLGDPGQGKNIRWILVLGVAVNLCILFHFKYRAFALQNLNLLLGTSFSIPKVRLPIGISFFTFQAMSYLIDVYRGTAKVQRNPLDLGLYISFFPQLIAGPIVRYNTLAEQLQHREVTLDRFQEGVCRFILGFAKKILLANNLAAVAERGFMLAGSGELTVGMAWLGSIAYTFQIYFDFSGYSDMAIGLGRLFGFCFEENFRFPYVSRSISEFWNRWHISLGHWFRDYVYFPLGGSRVSRKKLVRNLFVVWLLTGIWHGAAWQFVLWGLLHGFLAAFEKLTGIPKRFRSTASRVLYGVFTFLMVNFGWVLFGSSSLSAAGYQIAAMFGIGTAGSGDTALFLLEEYWPFLLTAALLSTPLLPTAISRLRDGVKHAVLYDAVKAALFLALLLLSVSYLAMGAHNPFIYFTF